VNTPACHKEGPLGSQEEAPVDIPAIYVGIDVAKAQLDVAVRPSGEQ